MVDGQPVFIEVELRAVVEIMTLQAIVHCPLLAFRGAKGEDEFFPKPVPLGQTGTDITSFDGGMSSRRAVAVFAAVVGQMRCLGHAEEAALKGLESLGGPANDMAGETLRVAISPRVLLFQRRQGGGVSRALPDLVGVGMAVAAGSAASKPPAGRMPHSRETKPL